VNSFLLPWNALVPGWFDHDQLEKLTVWRMIIIRDGYPTSKREWLFLFVDLYKSNDATSTNSSSSNVRLIQLSIQYFLDVD
jgi:hypothetical protein